MADPAPACPICRDSGVISRPYIAGVASVITLCGCAAGHRRKLELAPITGPNHRNPKPQDR